MTRTPWYSAYTNPVRIGWYECKLHGIKAITRMHWNGHGWQYDPFDPGAILGMSFGKWPGDRWRGLTEPAK